MSYVVTCYLLCNNYWFKVKVFLSLLSTAIFSNYLALVLWIGKLLIFIKVCFSHQLKTSDLKINEILFLRSLLMLNVDSLFMDSLWFQKAKVFWYYERFCNLRTHISIGFSYTWFKTQIFYQVEIITFERFNKIDFQRMYIAYFGNRNII